MPELARIIGRVPTWVGTSLIIALRYGTPSRRLRSWPNAVSRHACSCEQSPVRTLQ